MFHLALGLCKHNHCCIGNSFMANGGLECVSEGHALAEHMLIICVRVG